MLTAHRQNVADCDWFQQKAGSILCTHRLMRQDGPTKSKLQIMQARQLHCQIDDAARLGTAQQHQLGES